MKTFHIVRIDTDYNAYISTTPMEFSNLKEAEEWCRNNKGGGDYYYVDRSLLPSGEN